MKETRTKIRGGTRLGQAISEYLILTALIAVGSIAVIQILGSNLQRRLAAASNALGGISRPEVKGIKAEEKHYRVRDLGDFTKDIQDNGEH